MIRLLWLLLLLSAPIGTVWVGDSLVVSAPPGSLYLVGGGLPDRFIDRLGEVATLPAYGVDKQVTPLGRDGLVVKNQNGEVIVTLAIPEKPRQTYVMILPLIAR